MTTINGIKRFFTRPTRLGLMAAAGLMAGGALAAGFDGMTLVTNNWFDANFTALTAETPIAQDSTTGITRGAGSWTAVPTTGTAKIAADADAGEGATLLSINAEEGELTFTPAVLATATGMATVTVDVKTIAVDTLPTPEGGAQGAFAIYSPDGEAHSLAAYVSDGTAGVWTNLVYASAADLTNVWFTLTLDFATVSNVRYVRYSITPSAGSLTILADSEGTTWFQSASNATTVASVSFTGTGNIRTFSGDSLAEIVATYNGVGYPTIDAAVAAGVSDSWANGNVTLLSDVTWKPLSTGSYNIDADGHVLTIDGAIYTSEGTVYTVSELLYRKVWVQDFEDSATYMDQISGDTLASAIFGTTANTRNLPYAYAQGTRTIYNTTTASQYFVSYLEGNNTDNVVFAMPEIATSATDYIMEFDYWLGASYDNTTAYPSGLVIQGGSGVLATFWVNATSSKTTTTGYLYLGDSTDTTLASFTVAGRGEDPSNTSYAQYWLHVTIKGNAEDGVVMSVKNAAGTQILDETQISASFDVVAKLYMRHRGRAYGHRTALDDVAVYAPALSSEYMWVGTAGDHKWDTLANWSVGGETPMDVPSVVDTVVIPDNAGLIIFSQGAACKTLDYGTGVSFALAVSGVADTTAVLKLPTLFDSTTMSADDITIYGPYSKSVVDGVLRATRVPSVFTWVGESGASWNNTESWTVNGNPVYDLPAQSDTNYFSSALGAVTAVLDANTYIGTLTNETTLALTSSDNTVYICDNPSGVGQLVLSNITFRATSAKKAITISNAVDIPQDALATFLIPAGSSDNGYQFYLTGKLTGSGTLDSHSISGSNTYSGMHLDGDGAEFAGTVKLYSYANQNRDTHSVAASATSSNAVWRIYVDSGLKDISLTTYTDKTAENHPTNYLGAAMIKIPTKACGTYNVFEIGHLNQDSYITAAGQGRFGSYCEVRWIASTATYTNDASGLRILNICGGGNAVIASTNALSQRIMFSENGGTLKTRIVDNAKIDPSAVLTMSETAPIAFDDEGEDYTWETALASSNKGGFVKKGAGTLTLAAPPLYTGATTVEAGTLVVTNGTSAWEYTLGADTKASLARDDDIYVYTFTALTAEELPTQDEEDENQLDVPERMSGKSAAYNIAPGQKLDCSKLEDASGIKATVSTTISGKIVDMTGYYTLDSLTVNGGTAAITPQLDKSKVGVDLGKEDEGVDAPVTFTDTNPTFNLKNSVKKGLYYGVGTISDPTAENPSVTILVEKRATADGQEISLEVPSPDFSSGNVIYYKLSVSDTEQ